MTVWLSPAGSICASGLTWAGHVSLWGDQNAGTEAHLLDRHSLRLAMTGLTLWIGAGIILALMPKAPNLAGGQRATTVKAVFRQMFDGVLAAVALPGVLVVVLTATAAASRPGTSDAGTPSAVSPGNSAVKEWPVPAASARWRRDSAVAVPVRRSTATISTPGPRAAPRACRTSSPRAAGATGRRGAGPVALHSRKDWNNGGSLTFRLGRTRWSANAASCPKDRSRSPRTQNR